MAEIIATGNLAADAELRRTPSGSPVLNFRIGDSKSKKNGDNWETVAQNWFNVAVWGELAEMLSQKLTKGTRVKITGEFYQREYDKRDGSGQGISLDVNAWGVQVIPKRDNNGGAQSQGFNSQPTSQQQAQQNFGALGGQQVPQSDPWKSSQPPQNGGGNGGWGSPSDQPTF